MYLLGFDIGSSSIKAALLEVTTNEVVSTASFPSVEMNIISKEVGWAEQDPEVWWEALINATKIILRDSNMEPQNISAIGIAYQMHGLVLLDKNHKLLRPSIIWCDSRAVDIGQQALDDLGKELCFSKYLNAPGNFTASKLKWVKENEPEIYSRIHKIMLPGDYIAFRLTSQISTTISGLSEGILWDFKENRKADELLEYYGIRKELIPDVVPTFSHQGELTNSAAEQLGLTTGTPITYRAGDQPNNALSLGVYKPGQVAATGGTSGVVYAVEDKLISDSNSRINSFAHVNHKAQDPRIGLLLCINGAGIQYAWMKKQIANEGVGYGEMEKMIQSIPVGSDGLRIIPFGNGAERMVGNVNSGAQINNLQLNRHTKVHFFRAALEGIAYSFVMGMKMLKDVGLTLNGIKVGNDNLFQSAIFSSTISNLLDCPISVVDTSGAVGAAKASGIALNIYADLDEAFGSNSILKEYLPEKTNDLYKASFQAWTNDVEYLLKK